MKYGIREICDVVLKAKANQKIGNKMFYKGEPVVYFDSLKTSTMEGAATTVYAQGGRGNARLMAWEGERTVTFTMEDALISTTGLLILTGAGLVEPTTDKPIPVHVVETLADDKIVKGEDNVKITLSQTVSDDADATIYVMLKNGDNIVSEPYIAKKDTTSGNDGKTIVIKSETGYEPDLSKFVGNNNDVVTVDYYTDKTGGVQQIEITPDKFGGNFYLEASTLFRDTNGVDMPAEFIIPNCKVQSNFTFTMASSGDPSTFTFTMDAFPDYTRFDPTKKVLSVIQVITEEDEDADDVRVATAYNYTAS
jgi:hypothetical protein